MTNIIKNKSLGFVVLAALAGALIGFTRLSTVDAIAENRAAAEAAILSELLGGQPDLDARRRLCNAEIRGYAGVIRLLVLPTAVLPGAEVSAADHVQPLTPSVQAVRVLSHRETPGIGDFIEHSKSDWILGFNGLKRLPQSADTILAWNRSLDAVTGATITRRALINGVANACQP